MSFRSGLKYMPLSTLIIESALEPNGFQKIDYIGRDLLPKETKLLGCYEFPEQTRTLLVFFSLLPNEW